MTSQQVPRKCAFIFAGAHKTATTALQQACLDYGKELSKSGILFPSPITGFRDIQANHSYFIREIFGAAAWSRKLAQRNSSLRTDGSLNFAWKQLLASDHNLLIVAEGICQLELAELREFNDSLEAAGFHVKPFFCLRNPDTYLRSVVQQRVKGQGLRLSPESIIKLRIADQLSKVLTTWPDCSLLTFEQACESSYGPIGFYLSKLSILLPSPLVKAMGSTRSNPSGSDQAVRLSSFLNSIDLNTFGPKQIKARRAFIVALFRKLGGESFRLLSADLDQSFATEQIELVTLQINEALTKRIKQFVPYKPVITYGSHPAPWTAEVLKSLANLRYLCPEEWIGKLDGYVQANS